MYYITCWWLATYVDDILIATPTVKEHNGLLEKILQRLQGSGIHLREEKCHIGQEQLEYLGHVVDGTGIHPTEDKV